MTVADNLQEMVDRLRQRPPENAISLRSASARIISGWIKSGRSYPNEIIDGFIYIESSIEQSIEENIDNAVALERDTKDAYQFHISRFIDLLGTLENKMNESL